MTHRKSSRSGIGIDESEWEQPERLCTSSNVRGVVSGTPLGTPMMRGRTPMTPRTDSEMSKRSVMDTPLGKPIGRMDTHHRDRHRGGEWDQSTPSRGGNGIRDSTALQSETAEVDEGDGDKAPSSTPRTALSRRAMQRAGFLVQETPMLGEWDNGDGAIVKKTGNRGRKFYDPDEEDDEFDRDFYLSEEGPTFDTNGDNSGSFLGSSAKFKQREDQMAKSRALGEGKMAGMSAKKSQLHVDQSAWEDNRMLQSGWVL